MLKRLAIYLKEMFPLSIYVPYTIVTFFGMYFLNIYALGVSEITIGYNAYVGFFTVFTVMLLLRIVDEYKDMDTDRRLFPNRPLIRGAVKYSDIKTLGWVLFLSIIILNFISKNEHYTFIAMICFCYLMYKWFFLKNIISNNLVWALISHQPITLFVNAYIISIAMFTANVQEFNSINIISMFIYFFPITAWETSRKIRAKGGETDYVTYSKLFGPFKATLLPFFSLLITYILLFYISYELNFSIYTIITFVLMFVVVVFVFLRFMLNPIVENLKVRQISETSTTISFLAILIEVIFKILS